MIHQLSEQAILLEIIPGGNSIIAHHIGTSSRFVLELNPGKGNIKFRDEMLHTTSQDDIDRLWKMINGRSQPVHCIINGQASVGTNEFKITFSELRVS